MKATRYYPIFADLSGRRCVVVGGGGVAQRKTVALLGCGAHVAVVSPTLTRRLSTYARQGRIRHLARRVRPTDLRGAWLVCAATDDQAVNTLVSQAARRLKIFANVVDQTPLCSFIAPAIVRRGPLTIAVSTGGASPSLAKVLRRDIERAVGTPHVAMLRLLRDLRGLAKDRLADPRGRKRYFDRLLRGRTFALVREGKPAAARREALALLKRHAMQDGRS
ncbi:MAG: bifunctional precorrin-2 dehydrogenase/sirohydrochlorin ferrochelatase [Candidatus Omnitrophica bacterium]|nr:bifunctional precorrin-2 dehydrogenase/sirohydrochlorin ferrochelatase [Candidatus Omnitrophota bacterium]